MALQRIMLVVCDETPEHLRHLHGHEIVIERAVLPAPGYVTGRILDGGRWEMLPVDMRDRVTRLLDEAEALLTEPKAGELVHQMSAGFTRVQYLVLRSQLELTRRMANR